MVLKTDELNRVHRRKVCYLVWIPICQMSILAGAMTQVWSFIFFGMFFSSPGPALVEDLWQWRWPVKNFDFAKEKSRSPLEVAAVDESPATGQDDFQESSQQSRPKDTHMKNTGGAMTPTATHLAMPMSSTNGKGPQFAPQARKGGWDNCGDFKNFVMILLKFGLRACVTLVTLWGGMGYRH
ncbi:unnamed protein product [Amoebophrya sp. A120]|nr:unnamed protein product [Amoebophrya sp. A120]|eukprot:GSA120T00022268001.1